MAFPETGMKAVPGPWSGSECIRFLSSWNRKEKRTTKTLYFKYILSLATELVSIKRASVAKVDVRVYSSHTSNGD